MREKAFIILPMEYIVEFKKIEDEKKNDWELDYVTEWILLTIKTRNDTYL